MKTVVWECSEASAGARAAEGASELAALSA